jgi:hypothetical protein
MLTSTNSGLRSKKLLRFTKNFRSWRISQSLSRLLGLEGGVKTKSRLLDQDFSIVETSFLKLSRFSQQSRLTFCQCWDQESRLRHNLDKSRPPGLCINPFIISVMDAIKLCNKIEFWWHTNVLRRGLRNTAPKSQFFSMSLTGQKACLDSLKNGSRSRFVSTVETSKPNITNKWK